jgi:malic enzyme
VLARYRSTIPSFNDDIQGTAAVVLGGLLAALRITGGRLSEQRIVYAGAGAAGAGIGHLLADAMNEESGDTARTRSAQVFVDSRGLLHEGRTITESHKRPLALPTEVLAHYGLRPDGNYSLLETVRTVKPTVLIGTTAQPGTFSEDVIREMSQHVERPIIFALSNPTSKVECTPEEAIRWSEGRAIVATGTGFGPVHHNDRVHVIGQANNVFVFPGVGLGCILARAQEVDDRVFLGAARQLANMVSQDRLVSGAIYPDQGELRNVSAKIAEKVIGEQHRKHAARLASEDEIANLVQSAMWYPRYST